MLKICNDCNVEKAISQFYTKSRSDTYPTSNAGYSSSCKDCTGLRQQKYVSLNGNKKNLSDRKQHLKRYNLTVESYNEMFIAQDGKCLGCEKHQSEITRRFCVDHCHKTGKVRGLLCVMCNSVIGYANDDKNILLTLIKYLDLTKPELADYNTNVVEVKFPKKVG